MRLLLARHGRTLSNVRHLLDTAVPGPDLDELGRSQAAGLVDVVSDSGIGWIGSSELTRARQTAAPTAAALGLPVHTLPGLREVFAGDLEMRGDEGSVRSYLAVVAEWLHGRTDVRMPGGEDGAEFYARFDAAVAEAVDAAASVGTGTVLLLSHGAAIRTWAGSRVANLSADFVIGTGLLNAGVVDLHRRGEDWVCREWMGAAVSSEAAVGAGPAADPGPASVF